jgi:erythromycin esterase
MERRFSPSPRAIVLLAFLVGVACDDGDHSVHPLSFGSGRLYEQLEPLGRSIGESRIVLLGENGHGVGEFTAAKVKLVEWLHREHGFDVVVFESGFFECGHAWNRMDALSSEEALFQCLRYPFQHAELLPLFDLIQASRDTARPLILAGMDIQAQGYDSEIRPVVLRDVLAPIDPELADRLVAVDTALFQLPEFGGKGDEVDSWVLEHGEAAREIYARAAKLTQGWDSWVFRLALGRIARLTIRAGTPAGVERPARYYELRDEWMARAVSALAGSIHGERKVIVWLHNDHARYGSFSMSSRPHRSTGGYLREQYGSAVYSIGMFMGSGRIADNGRNIREVAALDPQGVESFLRTTDSPASYLVLRGNTDPVVVKWASENRPYLRMGIRPDRIVAAEEFDALLYIDQVGPPDYEIR